MGRKRWRLSQLNKEAASLVAEKFSIDPFTALLITKRGLSDDTQIEKFLREDSELIDPFTLPDMEVAIERINDAIFSFEKICVFGDYDADGVTATALLYSYLEMQGANVTYMLPDRVTDGYGLSKGVIDRMYELGISLVVTVDNGIAAVEEAKYIKSLGMELIITDHHLPGAELPDCVAVVDPHREDCDCEFRDFAGVGVAFKLASAIEGDSEVVLSDFADIIALGTVADIVPLVSENRILVKTGLKTINNLPCPGISALISVSGLEGREIKSSNISFGLAPRINAAGRMASAEKALELLLCEEEQTALEIAGELDAVNAERHDAENLIFKECTEFLDSNKVYASKPVIVVHGEGWHEGVLGIVASKLLDRYMRPVIVLTDKNGVSKGSARSIDGFSMFDALTAAKDHLEIYGGHAQAAGLTLKTENIEKFTEAVNAYADTLPVFYPELSVDCKLNPDALEPSLLDSISILEPFGCDNPSPLFGLFDLVIENITELGEKKQHLKITCIKPGKDKLLTLMKFNTPRGSFPFVRGDSIDVVATLDKNVWNGNVNVSVIIKDVRPSGMNDDLMVKSEKLFDKVLGEAELSVTDAEFALPDRAVFAAVYTYLKKNSSENSNLISINAYEYILSKTEISGVNLCKIRVALEAMLQLGLISVNDGIITVPPTTEKFDLFSAPIMKYLLNKAKGG